MDSPKYIIVVGCGRLGSCLASRLSSIGHDVVVIDLQEPTFKALTSGFSGFRLVGNAAEFEVLQRAKIAKADTLLAVTGEDNLNLMVAQVARIIFKVKTVMARVIDPARESVYRNLGVVIVSPTPLVAQTFLKQLDV